MSSPASPIKANDVSVYRQLVWVHAFDTTAIAPDDDRFAPALHALATFSALLDAPYTQPSLPTITGPRHDRLVLFPPGQPTRTPLKAQPDLTGYATLTLAHDVLVLTTIISCEAACDAADIRALVQLFPDFKRKNSIFLDECFYLGARVAENDADAFAAALLPDLAKDQTLTFSLKDGGGQALFLAKEASRQAPALLLIADDNLLAARAGAKILNETIPDVARLGGKIRHQNIITYDHDLRPRMEAVEVELAKGFTYSNDDVETAEHRLGKFAEHYRQMAGHIAELRRIRSSIAVNLRNIRIAAQKTGLSSAWWIEDHISAAEFARDQIDTDLGYFIARSRQAEAALSALALRLNLDRARIDRDNEDRNLFLTFWISIFGLFLALSGLIDQNAAEALHKIFFQTSIGSDPDHVATFGVRVIAILTLGTLLGAIIVVGAPLWRRAAKWVGNRLSKKAI